MASNATTNDIIKNFDNLTPGHKMMVLQNCISNLSFSDKKGLQNFIIHKPSLNRQTNSMLNSKVPDNLRPCLLMYYVCSINHYKYLV